MLRACVRGHGFESRNPLSEQERIEFENRESRNREIAKFLEAMFRLGQEPMYIYHMATFESNFVDIKPHYYGV